MSATVAWTCAAATSSLVLWLVSSPLGALMTSVVGNMIASAFYWETMYLERLMPQDERPARQEFDFIVVGGGPAGSVVANRLSEVQNWTVLLLEAGGEPTPSMNVPFFSGGVLGTNASWLYSTVPQNTSCGAAFQTRCPYPAGRVLGGGTAVNFMMAFHGNAKDYDNWYDMGNEGWSFDDVQPYLKKVEDVQIPELQDSEYRGYGGRVKISYPDYYYDAAKLILQAHEEVGNPLTDDYNGAQQTGAARIQRTMSNNVRWSATFGYVHPARGRPNFYLRTRSLVTRLLLNGTTVTGVEYRKGDEVLQAYATKEVIMAAGAVNTPFILMHSGIGPADHLQDVGISVVKDLPVGQNLMDHTAFIGAMATLNETVSPGIPEFLLDPMNYYDYFVKGTGKFTAVSPVDALSFHDMNGTDYYSSGWPRVEILYTSANLFHDQGTASGLGISEVTYNAVFRALENKPLILAYIIGTRPKSRGSVYLLDDDPSSPPQIDPRGFSDEDGEDVGVALAGIREFQKVLAAPSLQAVGAQIWNATIPGCEGITFDSDDYWKCAIRELSITVYHQSGTCKMGPSGDSSAVVGPDLKVVGVDGLRVADTSVMPEIITGHLQIPAYMLGERAADFIKADHDTDA